jgi:hypothetical protein
MLLYKLDQNRSIEPRTIYKINELTNRIREVFT